ncbi:MAG: nuclear transport factor 2 family protein, partial [Saprospiraceae bacterium]
MKLTKQQEKAVLRVHEAYWDYYMKGDVASMITLLDEQYSQVGSAEGEVFSNKKDAVQFLHDTISQVAGKLEMRNRTTKLENLEDSVIIHERADIYVLDGKKWIFYSKFRATTLLHKKGAAWKIIHQHSSFPDARAEEGQNIATEKIAAENLQLREAVKRRTTELEQKSRELEIEASLERVRAMALSMRTPDDLPGICEVLFIQLRALGFTEIRNAMINIHDDDKGSFINYDYSDEIGRSINHLFYNTHPLIEKQIKKIRSADDAFSESSFAGKDLAAWKKFRKKIGEKDDPRIKNIDALYYYFYSIGTGAIGISTFSAIPEEKLILLKRFRNVFNLSYQRYIDISLAEAQAREAQIEVALERVRARTMAMQRSEELGETAAVLFQQLRNLNLKFWSAGIFIWRSDNENLLENWMGNNTDGNPLPPMLLPYKEDDKHRTIYEVAQRGEMMYEKELKGKALDKHYKWLMSQPSAKPVFDRLKNIGITPPSIQWNYAAIFKQGYLLIIAEQPDSDIKGISKLFAKVFEQTYTRF